LQTEREAFQRDRETEKMCLKAERNTLKQDRKALSRIRDQNKHIYHPDSEHEQDTTRTEQTAVNRDLLLSFNHEIFRELFRRDIDKIKYQDSPFTLTDGSALVRTLPDLHSWIT